MISLNKRQLLIIKHLLNSDRPVASGFLATLLGANSKTIKSDMHTVSQMIACFGAELVSKAGTGYYIQVNDNNDYNTFVQIFNTKYKDSYSLPAFNSERVQNIIVKLLTSMNYVKVETLQDDMYFSRTTISNDLKDAKSILESYGLTIRTKPAYGMQVNGSEFCIRHAMADFLNADEDDINTIDLHVANLDYLLIKNTLIRKLSDYNILIAGSSLNKIINLIYVSLYRWEHGNLVTIDKTAMEEQRLSPEYGLTVDLFKELSMNLMNDEREICFFSLFVSSRRTLIQDDKMHIEKDKQLLKFSRNIVNYIYDKTEVDLFHDLNLKDNLCNHLRGLIVRLKYNIEKKHLPLMAIKQTSSAFEFAIIASEYITKELNTGMCETEVAYLAYAFDSYYTKYAIQRKIKLLIIMDGGRVVAQNFANYLNNNFQQRIEALRTLEFYQLDYTNAEDYDCIFTDIPTVNFDSPIPVLQFNSCVNPEDRAKLVNFFTKIQYNVKEFMNCFSKELFFTNVSASTKEEVIRYICEKLQGRDDVAPNLSDMVLYRESISSTERENCIALPHSLYYSSKYTFIAVCILKRPILWDKEYVSVVLFTSIGTLERFPYLSLGILNTFLANKTIVYEMLNSTNYERFIKLFEQSDDL